MFFPLRGFFMINHGRKKSPKRKRRLDRMNPRRSQKGGAGVSFFELC